MAFAHLRQRLLARHAGHPQNNKKIELVLRELESGLAALTALGEHLHLVEGPWPGDEWNTWPRTYFHLSSASNGRLVASPFELQELGPDWHPTLNEAAHAEGMAKQFAGRGGIRRSGQLIPVAPAEFTESPEAARLRRIAEFRVSARASNQESQSFNDP